MAYLAAKQRAVLRILDDVAMHTRDGIDAKKAGHASYARIVKCQSIVTPLLLPRSLPKQCPSSSIAFFERSHDDLVLDVLAGEVSIVLGAASASNGYLPASAPCMVSTRNSALSLHRPQRSLCQEW